jgi:hypothetical protein
MSGIEWDELVKPAVYVWELVLSAVVAFGTADKLLYTSSGRTRCALNDSVATCSMVISISAICLIGVLCVLWRRLVSAFADEAFPKVDESGLCILLAVGWLVVAAVISANVALPASDGPSAFRATRDVVTTFAWLNCVSFIVSAALAAYKPEDSEVDEAHLEYQSLQRSASQDQRSTAESVAHFDGTAADSMLLGDGGQAAEFDARLESAGLRKVDSVSNPFVEIRAAGSSAPAGCVAGEGGIGASLGFDDDSAWGLPRRRKPLAANADTAARAAETEAQPPHPPPTTPWYK